MKQRPQFAAFDFESEGLGGKALAFSWCLEDGAPHYYTHDNPAVIEDYALQVMLDNPAYRWYAHNAQYDWRYLIPAIRRTKTPTVYLSRTATDIYSIRLNPDSETPCNMVDSMAMWPGSLASMLDTFCPELPKLKIDVTKFDRKDPEHIAYSKRDAEGLVTAMIRFDQTMLEAYGEHIQLTTAGTSMKAWRRTIPDGTQYSPPLKYEEFIRQSYFGGYVIPHNIAAWENCKTYDINSSYPASMRDYEYPNGAATETRKFNEDCLGIYECEVKTPEDCTVPLLGKKEMRNKTDVTNWPRGNFKTVATSPEIKFARDHGYEVKVIRGIFFESVCRPFVDFVKMSQKTRIQNKGTPLEAVCKLMQNSLYGKFGAQRVRSRVIDSAMETVTGNAAPLGDQGLYRVTEFSDDMQVSPAWASFVTAYSRIRLFAAMYEAGLDNVLYADTDSITLKSGCEIETGTDYGQFKLEKTWRRFRVGQSKVYAGELDNGEWKGAAKGMPKKHMGIKQWQAIYNNEPLEIEYDSLPGFIQFLSGKGELHKATRKLSHIDNSKNWESKKDGTVYPIETRQQQELF